MRVFMRAARLFAEINALFCSGFLSDDAFNTLQNNFLWIYLWQRTYPCAGFVRSGVEDRRERNRYYGIIRTVAGIRE